VNTPTGLLYVPSNHPLTPFRLLGCIFDLHPSRETFPPIEVLFGGNSENERRNAMLAVDGVTRGR
jgi:hypothetical protein